MEESRVRIDFKVVRPREILGVAVGIVAVFGAASLVASIVDDSGEDRLLEATLDCSSYIDVVSDLPEGFNVVEGVSAIHSTIVHQQGRQGTDDDPESPLRFSKIALLVRPNQSFQVSVGENSPEPTRIGWSSATSNSPVQRISVGPCPGHSDRWLVFAGGVWVTEPSCVELLFQTPNASDSVWLSIAEQCR